jgi:hypothetical protein
MNTQRDTPQDHDARFDAAMRALHRDALDQLTPAVRWRLKPARPALPRSAAEPRGARMAPLWAGGVAAVCALAVGVGLWRSADPVAPAAPAAQLVMEELDEDAATVLGEDPDFYAWLASDDADLVAME